MLCIGQDRSKKERMIIDSSSSLATILYGGSFDCMSLSCRSWEVVNKPAQVV